MEPARFYGSSKHVNTIPCDGSVSEDESASDSDSDYVPSHYALRHGRSLIIPETDNDSSDDREENIENIPPLSRCWENIKKKQEKHYWWETSKRHLHSNDNTDFIRFGNLGHDKLFKFRPLLEEFSAVDEQIIPTKCRNQLKQYNPAKPHEWGYKNQVLSGASGFSYDFDIFAGEQSNTFPDGAPDLGNGLSPLGTVRLNRVPNSEMPTAKDFKKQGRGFIVEKVAVIDNIKIGITTWFDNKPENMLSTYVGSDIPCPQAVEVYHRHMGGVDLLDSILGLYRIYLRSEKMVQKNIFFHMVDMCVVDYLP
ncbi:hypothetical protein JTB14_015732 [Gonioctena quinquepunctata]|nr:hypothetical protein JTB14_015732 [Gonioctena quinquepunctata]